MKLEEVYKVEQEKWDEMARQDVARQSLVARHKNFEEYARKGRTTVGVAEFLGDLRGKQVLEIGCGLGEIAVLLAKSGAKVTAFDLSPMSVRVSRQRAEVNGVTDDIDFLIAPGETLPFADNSFDAIVGKGILHHLNVDLGKGELYRVLKPGGKAAFVEPMGMNPVLNFVRAYVPYPDKNPRGADKPLNYKEIRGWGEKYKEFKYRELQLLSMLERGLGFRKRIPGLSKIDNWLLKYVPFLRRYCRYVVMTMVKGWSLVFLFSSVFHELLEM
jgi:ubiquinone/menaquinone biosynthesis C-methylase UbiE